ncbi:hypothetical protein ACVDG8_001265 [Mesorhizobium sp. ORM8.1]
MILIALPEPLNACERARMWKTVQLLSAASLCGCVAAAPPPPEPSGTQHVDPMPVSLALEEIITAGVRPHLSNPLSARFGTILAGERTLNGRQEIVACGTVNDKKSSGAADRDLPFVAKIHPDTGNSFELVAIDDSSPNARLRVANTCRDAGLPMLDAAAKTHP